MLAFELEAVLEWEFEVATLGKGINLYYLWEERCVDIWAEERASLLWWQVAFLYQHPPRLL